VNLLIDTHILLWWDSGAEQLNAATRAAIEDPRNQIYVSVASIWEIAIKKAKGKLHLAASGHVMLESNGFLALAIQPEHAEAAGALAWPHSDPFDRMLVAQARTERLTLVHADKIIRVYKEIPQLWAC
jgi:PIN domain nuclease of toxin-antitoxin system